jgi:hypothetical protein
MDLVRDILDQRVVDRNGRDMGRVDAVLLEVRPGRPPRVAALQLGPAVLASRLSPALGRWVARLEHALGIDEGRPVSIPFSQVLDHCHDVKVDLAFGETAAASLERRLRRWISRLPRSS